MALLAIAPAQAQEAGWHYSPLPGEGDRATLGCASGSSPQDYACIAVRCEDDFSVGFYLHTTRREGDAAPWAIDVDKDHGQFVATLDSDAPYGARIAGDLVWLRDGIEQGAVAYLQPLTGQPLQRGVIPLGGSLAAITQALAYCAPRGPKAASEPNAPQGVELPTNTEN
ncbi:MAG: hypothetical protein ACOH2M_10595 [Cypionkella sp.]